MTLTGLQRKERVEEEGLWVREGAVVCFKWEKLEHVAKDREPAERGEWKKEPRRGLLTKLYPGGEKDGLQSPALGTGLE